nr:phosphotransferase [uncultured Albidiferax sp.]
MTLDGPKSVSFDFRFDRETAKHESMIAVRQELAHQFAVDHAGADALRGVSLYPVARAGKSGSEVFYLDLAIIGHGIPERLVAKFQSKADTEKEAKGARSAAIARLGSNAYSLTHSSEDLGIIVYNLAASRDHIEFRGFFLDTKNSDDNCAAALRAAFQDLGKDPNSEAPSKLLLDDFDRYLNRRTRPLERVGALSLAAPAQAGIGDVAATIYRIFQRIKREFNVEVFPYLVHGDLHARNLMLSQSNPSKTELIDFDWVHSGHPAKDFVLMECTLKYMLLTELLQAAKAPLGDDLYIQAQRIEAFEQYLCKHCFDLPSAEEMVRSVFGEAEVPPHQARALSRVYASLIEVRGAAGRVLRAYCIAHTPSSITPEQHYFASFFLVTVGLLGYTEIDQVWAMIGLQTIGEYL